MNTFVQIETVGVRAKNVSQRHRGLRRFLRNTRGASFVEYLALIAAVGLAGGMIFSNFKTGMQGAAGTAATKVQELFGK